MFLFARNEEINKWLAENPLVLGGGALLLGLVLVGFGAKALLTGKSASKYGTEFQGPLAYLHGGVLAGFGVLVVLFGLYKMLLG